jgi:excisionase family DNA binding protein
MNRQTNNARRQDAQLDNESIDWPYKRPCTKKELAAELCTTERFIEREVNRGHLRAIRLGLRSVRFLPSDVVRWLNTRPTTEKSQP